MLQQIFGRMIFTGTLSKKLAQAICFKTEWFIGGLPRIRQKYLMNLIGSELTLQSFP